MSEEWAEQAEEAALELFGGGDEASTEKALLDISPTNRTIANREQAVILASLRVAHNYYKKLHPDNPERAKWLSDVCDIVESYQLTLDGEQNSRRQYIKVAIARSLGNIRSMFSSFKNEKNQDVI